MDEAGQATRRVPQADDFPAGTQFVIKEFDVPLARVPGPGGGRWINWFGGVARPYDASRLSVGNHWPAGSFAGWQALVAASLP
ncbi:hypothetical protein [Pseudoduganella chitinolytica]|uniref:Uncharacterized protein n=1 Tax=Pseudoduganella chitinolytica TaxID=34070 RepID=A0ABY8BBD8_9BURK|nr:hypothetical protein [Pseudoduganella chitinolytica]WEF31684.1 hypothetical protein PX653_19810 [Pseudoduganella chitinolytica]